tara:strand:- start:108 stop:698 length:591 start_codon:yes stop_codon:yes gene_type:complete
MSDEKHYQRVIDELDGKPRKYTDQAIWTKAEFLSKGDPEKTRYKYIELRVEKLNKQDEIRAEKELQKEKDKKEREKARRKLFEANAIKKEQEKEEKEKQRDENYLKQLQLEKEQEEQEELKETNSLVFWITFASAFAAGRFFGLVGVGSVFLGYLTYKYASAEYSIFISILSGVAVTVISYFVGVLVFVIGLETLL